MLLRWPARLERFTCLGRTRFGYSPLDLRCVWSALVPHLLSLASIRIGSVPNPDAYSSLSDLLAGVDFTLFESLTFLSLSYWVTGAGTGEASLLAPHLETFEWIFDADDKRPLFLNRFDQQEEDFLRRLVTAAVRQKVPLRKIAIVFTPAPRIKIQHGEASLYMGSTETDFSLEYPWDRMDRLAAEIRHWGIELTYNKPSVSREEFDTVVFSPPVAG